MAGGRQFALVCLTYVAVLWNALLSFQTSGASVADLSNVTPSSTSTSPRPLFTLPADADRGALLLPNIKDPIAVDAQTVCPGYLASNVQNTKLGLTATLALANSACNVYGTDIDTLSLTVEYQSSDRLSVNIVPAYIGSLNQSHFLLSEALVPKPAADSDAHLKLNESDLMFNWSNEPTFSFKVSRKSTGDVLFNTEGSVLVFENQFLEFVTVLPQNYHLYGLGEHIHGLRLGNNFTATAYAADVADTVDANLYGSHPFYLDTRYFEVQADKKLNPLTGTDSDPSRQYISYSHGVFLRNTHGHEVLLRPGNLTWRALGGSVDLYFYAGPSQAEVTKSFQLSTVGLPAMQQYFTFGYHQCRWGYRSWTELADVVSNFERFEIPLEAIWTDIDYMNMYRDFETDPVSFSLQQGRQFLSNLHESGRHWIPIVDAAIYIPNPDNPSDGYETYNRGNASDIFLRNPGGSLYIGAVWPGYTVFPDWLALGSQEWWASEIEEWHAKVPFDGMWIDMNEASSFCVGSCGSRNLSLNPVHPPFRLPGDPGNVDYGYPENFHITNASAAASASAASSSQAAAQTTASSSLTTATVPDYLRTTPTPGVRNINYPPYVINHARGDLAGNAVSPNATHADGTVEYDVHNLYGHQLLNATYHGLRNLFPGKRPFIIGRSTFPGSGKWAGHWGGDNVSRWAYMYFSIPQALSFSLFGIPMFGVDTCGFSGNTDEELCNRWMQLSAFFPFYRNHNVLGGIPQEPYVWASVMEAAKSAMAIRYALLPYIYTLFYQAHTTGSTVMRALAWEFPNDPSLVAADRQFLLGPSLMIVPVLQPQASTVDGVFPGVRDGEVWYDWYTQEAVNAVAGKNTTIDAPLGHIPVYVRGGSVLPMQEPALTIRDARRTPWSLLAALDHQGRASGQLYLDDGESVDPRATLFVTFVAENNSLAAQIQGQFEDQNPLDTVAVLGVSSPPSQVTFNGVPVPPSSISYNASSRVFSVSGLKDISGGKHPWSKGWILRW